jgi:hypothetical protein
MKPKVEDKPERIIDCCIGLCSQRAVCRVWTKTGWANVCTAHYRVIETVPRRSESPLLEQMRKGVRFRTKAKQTREPGSDDEPQKLDEILADMVNA